MGSGLDGGGDSRLTKWSRKSSALLMSILFLLVACEPPLAADLQVPDQVPVTWSPPTREGLRGKVMFGYQGWFDCKGVGTPTNTWLHWFNEQAGGRASIRGDLWPDIAELGQSERCPTTLLQDDGSPAELFSSFNAATVMRHFRWMSEYGIDGIFLQRFICCLDPARFSFNNRVVENVRTGAEEHGRVFALMYDVSLTPASELVTRIKNDWSFLVDSMKITSSPQYLHHSGRPVLGIWGLGIVDRPGTAADAATLIDYFHNTAPSHLRASLVGGVPNQWLSLTGDSKSDPQWAEVYRSWDVISPWSVAQYRDEDGADFYRERSLAPGLAAAQRAGVEYMPVVFPGFSWHNQTGDSLNAIRRHGGLFFWRQVYNAIDAGADMIYVAMFDEIDEGTAMFKVVPTVAGLPKGAALFALDADGYNLPSDWYLRLGGAAGKALRDGKPVSAAMPLPLPSPNPVPSPG
jgi:hypothetical protein